MKVLGNILFAFICLFVGSALGSNFTEKHIYEDCKATQQHKFNYFGKEAYYACIHPSNIKDFAPKD